MSSYFQAINAEDWALLRSLWHEDVQLRAVGARGRAGIDDAMSYYTPKLFAPWREHEDRPLRILMSGDTAVVELVFLGTTHDGRSVTFDAVDIIDVEDGKIRKIAMWYDIAYARKAISGSAG